MTEHGNLLSFVDALKTDDDRKKAAIMHLKNAAIAFINAGMFDAAHDTIDVLEKMK